MKIIGTLSNIETIAEGHGIRELAKLRQNHGDGNWKKKKGIAMIQLDNGHIARAETRQRRGNSAISPGQPAPAGIPPIRG